MQLMSSLRFTLTQALLSSRIIQQGEYTGCFSPRLDFNFKRRWEAQPNSQVTFTVPDGWTSGRIWVRVVYKMLVFYASVNTMFIRDAVIVISAQGKVQIRALREAATEA